MGFLGFLKKKTSFSDQGNFSEASAWVQAFGNGDDSVLEPLLHTVWHKENGATATLFQLAQESWSLRINELMRRVQRDLQLAASERGLTVALSSLRSALVPLQRFSSWNAFDGEPRADLLKNLNLSLDNFLTDLDRNLQRNPNSSQALLSEVKMLRSSLTTIVSSPVVGQTSTPASAHEQGPATRKIIFPK